MTTGYEPLETLKSVGPDIWIADGPVIRFYRLPFPTRMTAIRLADGSLWVHSPIRPTEPLLAELAALGEVRHLIAPNWIHYAALPAWQARFSQAVTWVAPGVAARAASRGVDLRIDREIDDDPPPDWVGQIDQMIVRGSKVHREAVFFHRASKVLILTDLIEKFEPQNLGWLLRWVTRAAHVQDPDGQMPRDMRLTFRRGEDQLRIAVERMIDWAPDKVILAHGRWYDRDGVAELRRAFAFVLQES
jgi:hypothetical protein